MTTAWELSALMYKSMRTSYGLYSIDPVNHRAGIENTRDNIEFMLNDPAVPAPEKLRLGIIMVYFDMLWPDEVQMN